MGSFNVKKILTRGNRSPISPPIKQNTMNLTPEQFVNFLLSGKTEKDANKKESEWYDKLECNKLIKKYGHTLESAIQHLTTDYFNGFTICKCCGTFYQLGAGFTKHLSTGCLNCEGEEKHHVYYHKGNNEKYYKTNPRWMATYFDDGLHYCKDNAEIGKFKHLFTNDSPNNK